eukprot:CAMPEP_0114529936 /NCGR_PEP_ID=MMETSP0109-20121206/25140_1 /TAXON_ID=29199 /ORGANISM="Chlorarachnion reptans, Strain CCCM449" /LENGTH=52 /DNA_ID=CAMNT_0001712451 /DNA_START=743 /DNA_END=901 /DNA_ORIENTATION=-
MTVPSYVFGPGLSHSNSNAIPSLSLALNIPPSTLGSAGIEGFETVSLHFIVK